MTITQRPDGWHVLDSLGTDIGPFATLAAVEEFLDWWEVGT